MKTVLFSLLSIFMFASPALAQTAASPAGQAASSEIESQQDVAAVENGDLDDYMSPDEIAKELGPKISMRAAYTNRLQIIVDKAERGASPTAQTVQVYLDGRMVYNWYVSTGREGNEHPKAGSDYVSSTPTGNFRIEWMDINHFSKTWAAPMPFAMFFSGGIAIHATVASHLPQLGTRASGGCVRLHPVNAEQLWNLVHQVGSNNVLISIHNG
jgi:hypothetical protein